MIFLNEYEIDSYTHLFDPDLQPNLAYGARCLARLAYWADCNSDGWAYWRKPLRASARLQQTLYDYARNNDRDCPTAEMRKCITPIKAFLTRQGADWMTVVPKEVWL